MTILVLGLLLFLGAHSVRIVADAWRSHMMARIGEKPWKGLYSLVSIAGFVLIVIGFGQARLDSPALWHAPLALRHLTALLVLVALVLVFAAKGPNNAIRSRLHHPMVLGVKLWAFAHLLVNGRVVDVVLFGGFLLWAMADFRSARQRDRAQQTAYPPGSLGASAIPVILGGAVWALFVFWAHRAWIGVSPLGF